MKTWKIAGINFDHMHMGDLLRMVHEHPHAQIVGVCDERPERMKSAISDFKISDSQVFTDYHRCVESTRPDLVILCPDNNVAKVLRTAGMDALIPIHQTETAAAAALAS